MADPLWRIVIVGLLIIVEAFVTCMQSALGKANVSFFEKKVEEEQDKKSQVVLKLLEKENLQIPVDVRVRLVEFLLVLFL